MRALKGCCEAGEVILNFFGVLRHFDLRWMSVVGGDKLQTSEGYEGHHEEVERNDVEEPSGHRRIAVCGRED